MKNKKGFTLVELLAVVALLAVLAAVVTPAISSISKKSKEKMYRAKVKMIEEAAVMYFTQNQPKNSNGMFVRELCVYGFLKSESCNEYSNANDCCQINPSNDKPMGLCFISVTKNPTTNRYTATLTSDNAADENNPNMSAQTDWHHFDSDSSYCNP